MSKYPYIGKGKEIGSIVLFYGECESVTLESKTWASSDLQYSNFINESAFENITADYLSNTKVKIESEEHAEFVIKLFNSAFGTEANSMNPVWVYNEGLRGVSQRFHGEPSKDLKQITIPLPPKEPEIKEWPQVGDEVETSDGNGVVKLLADSKGYYVVSVNDEYYQYQIDELSKPKTPEEELRDEIIEVINNDVYKGVYSKEILSVFADALMSKFEITKKPQ